MHLKHFILSATIIYLLGVLIGYHIEPALNGGLSVDIKPVQYSEQPKSKLLLSIAGNNISVALINIIGGFSLGVISLLNTLYNGAVLGYACAVALRYYPAAELLSHLLPHSLELVSIVLSCSMGLYVGFYLFKKFIMNKKPVFEYKGFISCSAVTFIIIMISAVLEVYVSMSL